MNVELSIPNVSALESDTYARHRWYFFKEAFSPALVEHAIAAADLKQGSVVVDPFSGSGTTPLTAALSGHAGRGIEVNPFLRFVADAKGSEAKSERFKAAVDEALAGAKSLKRHRLEEFSTFSEKAELAQARGKWLFNSDVLRAFGGAWERTVPMPSAVRKLTRLCLIGAAMDAANAEKDGKCLRYKNEWRKLKLGRTHFTKAIQDRASKMALDLDSSALQSSASKIVLGDSRNARFDASFDLCVTSPPYLNSFDYTDVYRPELFLGRFVRSMSQLRTLRQATLRSHVQTKWKEPTKDAFGSHYADTMKGILTRTDGLWDRRLPQMIQAYFEDMAMVLQSLRRQAKPRASVMLVVSTSAYSGVEIPVDLILADIAACNGWFLREVVVLRYLRRVSGQQWHQLNGRKDVEGPHLRESLLILDTSPRG